MWCWFKGWRGWRYLCCGFRGLRFFYLFKERKGWGAEHTEPRPPPCWGDAPGGLSSGHPLDPRTARGSAAPGLPWAPHSRGFGFSLSVNHPHEAKSASRGLEVPQVFRRRNQGAPWRGFSGGETLLQLQVPPSCCHQIHLGSTDLAPKVGSTRPRAGRSEPPKSVKVAHGDTQGCCTSASLR